MEIDECRAQGLAPTWPPPLHHQPRLGEEGYVPPPGTAVDPPMRQYEDISAPTSPAQDIFDNDLYLNGPETGLEDQVEKVEIKDKDGEE